MSALLELIQEQRWSQIRVQDILDRTGVGRSTFYSHFDNKFDLLMSGVPEVVLIIDTDAGDLASALLPIFEHVVEVQQMLRPLLSQPLAADMRATFQQALTDGWSNYLAMPEPEGGRVKDSGSLAEFLGGAMMAVMMSWLDRSCAEPAAKVCADFSRLAERVLQP